MAGAGVWWPNRKLSEKPLSEAEQEMALHEQNEVGLQLCAAIAGMGGSSTGAEIAAGIIAMAASEEVHMGTDSQSVMNSECNSSHDKGRPKAQKTKEHSEKWGLGKHFAKWRSKKDPTV